MWWPGIGTANKGTFTFEPIDGAGEYYFYYLPYAMAGHAHYPQAQYLPARPTADPAWVNAVSPSVWWAEQGLHGKRAARRGGRPLRGGRRVGQLRTHELHGHGRRIRRCCTQTTPAHPSCSLPRTAATSISMKDAIPAHWAIAGPAVRGRGGRSAGQDCQCFRAAGGGPRCPVGPVRPHGPDRRLRVRHGNRRRRPRHSTLHQTRPGLTAWAGRSARPSPWRTGLSRRCLWWSPFRQLPPAPQWTQSSLWPAPPDP